MDLELLRTFLEVNRHRNFGKAAEGLHVTQSAISARIRLLEKQLGVKLFVRHYHDIQLTAEGHRLVRHADLQLSLWRKARQDVALGGATTQLTIGGSLRLWDVALQEWFHTVRRSHPDMALIAETHTPDRLTQRLLDGHLDVAFMLEPAQLERLQVIEVANIELVLVSSSDKQTADTALAENFVMVDWGLAQALRHRRLFPDSPEPQVRVSQARMALSNILALGGSAYLPLRMVISELNDGKLFLVDGAPTMEHHAYAVYPLRSEKIDLIETVIEYFEYSVTG